MGVTQGNGESRGDQEILVKGTKFQLCKMYNNVTTVNITVLYTWNC